MLLSTTQTGGRKQHERRGESENHRPKPAKLLFFVRLVDQSKGPATEHLAAHKPQLRRRRPVWEEPPSPSHDVGHN
jgi:hypothetical protein